MSKQRTLAYHVLVNPISREQKEYSMLQSTNRLGSYKNTELETRELIKRYRSFMFIEKEAI